MKFLSAVTLLLATPLVSAASFPSFFDPSQARIRVDPTQDFPVAGENPLSFCANPADHLLEIDRVDLSPNPPKPGTTLNIKASGVLKETVEKGATVNLEVKWGLITLVKQTVDLCDQIKNVDLTCPLENGDLVLEKQVDLPKQIPPGKYSVLADVYTKDQKQVTCLKTDNIQF
ncbi:MD-2-related lipid-recognition [Penicillium capsulatum]|uniref:Phosphatidylglycerol/phosphatidylinositol transfer protein n=1 Tax=Penicillium capsulatum TaxID=69766 RepID=A0A9W9IC75_9EURO|nr:MD-2-related lipid-recognition [Penicillium capsulatum]KAJ6135578.1 MD-2-related lipid-recognition [Penicillium capsulatum]